MKRQGRTKADIQPQSFICTYAHLLLKTTARVVKQHVDIDKDVYKYPEVCSVAYCQHHDSHVPTVLRLQFAW